MPDSQLVSRTGTSRFRARLGFALRGLAHALRTEASLRLQALAGAAALLVLLVCGRRGIAGARAARERCLVAASSTPPSSISPICAPAAEPAVRLLKDCAAAGVLVAVLGALGVAAALLVHLLSGAP